MLLSGEAARRSSATGTAATGSIPCLAVGPLERSRADGGFSQRSGDQSKRNGPRRSSWGQERGPRHDAAETGSHVPRERDGKCRPTRDGAGEGSVGKALEEQMEQPRGGPGGAQAAVSVERGARSSEGRRETEAEKAAGTPRTILGSGHTDVQEGAGVSDVLRRHDATATSCVSYQVSPSAEPWDDVVARRGTVRTGSGAAATPQSWT